MQMQIALQSTYLVITHRKQHKTSCDFFALRVWVFRAPVVTIESRARRRRIEAHTSRQDLLQRVTLRVPGVTNDRSAKPSSRLLQDILIWCRPRARIPDVPEFR